MKLKPPTIHRPYHVNYLEGFYLNLARDIIKKFPQSIRAINRPSLGRFLRPAPKVRIEWIIISFLLAVVLSGARARIIPESVTPPPKPKLIKQLPQTHLEATQTVLEPVPVPEPVVAPAPVYTAPTGVTACGSDPNMAYIYQHESGCRTDAINPIGACGIGQALPCSKMGCPLSDWACQNNFFTNYAITRYGSTYNAYLFWTAHSWY